MISDSFSEVCRLVGEIQTLGAMISNSTEADVFVRFSGHVELVDIEIHLSGWNVEGQADIKHEVITRDSSEENVKTLKKIVEEMMLILLKGGMDLEKIGYYVDSVEYRKVNVKKEERESVE